MCSAVAARIDSDGHDLAARNEVEWTGMNSAARCVACGSGLAARTGVERVGVL